MALFTLWLLPLRLPLLLPGRHTGHLVLAGQATGFVDDWSAGSPAYRTNDRTFPLRAGTYYPIYLEWTEATPPQTAFVPGYRVDGSSWRDITTEIFPSRSRVLALVPEAVAIPTRWIPPTFFMTVRNTALA